MVAPQQPSSFESSESTESSESLKSSESESSSSSISPRKFAANRRNARKSTGPRTAEGKARSSRNAISHGVYCRDALIPGEDAHHFFVTRQGFLRALKPQDAVQLALVDAMTHARWRLNRCTRAEACMLVARQDRSQNQFAAKLRAIEEDYKFTRSPPSPAPRSARPTSCTAAGTASGRSSSTRRPRRCTPATCWRRRWSARSTAGRWSVCRGSSSGCTTSSTAACATCTC